MANTINTLGTVFSSFGLQMSNQAQYTGLNSNPDMRTASNIESDTVELSNKALESARANVNPSNHPAENPRERTAESVNEVDTENRGRNEDILRGKGAGSVGSPAETELPTKSTLMSSEVGTGQNQMIFTDNTPINAENNTANPNQNLIKNENRSYEANQTLETAAVVPPSPFSSPTGMEGNSSTTISTTQTQPVNTTGEMETNNPQGIGNGSNMIGPSPAPTLENQAAVQTTNNNESMAVQTAVLQMTQTAIYAAYARF